MHPDGAFSSMEESNSGQRPLRSRVGCTECRRKKVKCDFKQPVCTRCTRWPRYCKYETNFVSFTGPTEENNQLSPIFPATSGTASRQPSSPTQVTMLIPALSRQLSPHLQSSEACFFMHHFATQTCRTLFPFAPQFGQSLMRAAVDTPYLLYAILAASCGHHMQLTCDNSQKTKTAILKFTSLSVTKLRETLQNSNQRLDSRPALTAMVLCTNDVCHGNLDAWETHLAGTKNALSALLRQPGDMTKSDEPYISYLVQWYATLDTIAVLSERFQGSVRDVRAWPTAFRSGGSCSSGSAVDAISGYTADLLPLLLRLWNLTRMRQAEPISGSFRADAGVDVPEDYSLTECLGIEREIMSLKDRTAPKAIDQSTGGAAGELYWTNAAFADAALLYLHRRVLNLPKYHSKVRTDVDNILQSVQRINADSLANILVLWPIFSAGWDTDILAERELLRERMLKMRRIGVGNFTRAYEILQEHWLSNTDQHWSSSISERGKELILF
ncbi:fungal-specific transcription factor domain-containing protein [Xylariales sp. PMI_506]|nr:fungal-specific transcription factor domain-containing protein [Xylariales sp. PMI_506]